MAMSKQLLKDQLEYLVTQIELNKYVNTPMFMFSMRIEFGGWYE